MPRARALTYRGRICGRCLLVTWHPDSVRAGWCPTCLTTTTGQTVALPEQVVDVDALQLLRAVRALVTP